MCFVEEDVISQTWMLSETKALYFNNVVGSNKVLLTNIKMDGNFYTNAIHKTARKFIDKHNKTVDKWSHFSTAYLTSISSDT